MVGGRSVGLFFVTLERSVRMLGTGRTTAECVRVVTQLVLTAFCAAISVARCSTLRNKKGAVQSAGHNSMRHPNAGRSKQLRQRQFLRTANRWNRRS